MAKFTVAVCEKKGTGTHFVTGVDAPDIETAKQEAIAECLANWGSDWDGCIDVLFVAQGDVQFIEYQEPWI